MVDSSPAHCSTWGVFLIFLRLGLTSFGGPVAHLGYLHEEFVIRRRWLDARSYADLVALCQFLPGPASSQVAIALGLWRAGYAGALAAWAGFVLPSATALILFALGLTAYGEAIPSGVLHGLKLVTVAVVAQAVWAMARSLCTDLPRISIMVLSSCLTLWLPAAWGQLVVIVVAALVGLRLTAGASRSTHESLAIKLNWRAGALWLALFFGLLGGLPLLGAFWSNQVLSVVDTFYRAGTLVFGGGHVVLPLLQAQVVPAWISNDTFLAGYAATQAVPGPLFTFAAFLGASMHTPPGGSLGGLICLLAVFAPSFLLVFGVLPFWEHLRHHARLQAACAGINAAVVGLLLAALFGPIWLSSIDSTKDLGLALVALAALMLWKLPAWVVVFAAGGMGWLFSLWS